MTDSAAGGSQGATFAGPTRGGAALWRRFRRDRAALAALAGLSLIVLACFVLEPLLEQLLGHGPDEPFPNAVNIYNRQPVGWFSVVHDNGPHAGKTFFLLGGDGPLGRDEFLRLLAGGRASLEIAIGATLLAMVIGTFVGCVAGYYRGWTDVVLSRVTEFAMGFPILFLVIALGFTISDRLSAITLHGLFVPGALSLIAVIGIFNWFYIARIVRSQVLTLREREFVEAARMAGSSDRRIIVRHLLPHLSGTLTVYGSLVLAGTIILEAGLSFLNFGVPLPNASWGNMMSTNWGTVLYPSGKDPAWVTSSWTSIWPAVAIFSTVLAFALFAEGVRRALDPLEVR